jgi:hypothetical protein
VNSNRAAVARGIERYLLLSQSALAGPRFTLSFGLTPSIPSSESSSTSKCRVNFVDGSFWVLEMRVVPDTGNDDEL